MDIVICLKKKMPGPFTLKKVDMVAFITSLLPDVESGRDVTFSIDIAFGLISNAFIQIWLRQNPIQVYGSGCGRVALWQPTGPYSHKHRIYYYIFYVNCVH